MDTPSTKRRASSASLPDEHAAKKHKAEYATPPRAATPPMALSNPSLPSNETSDRANPQEDAVAKAPDHTASAPATPVSPLTPLPDTSAEHDLMEGIQSANEDNKEVKRTKSHHPKTLFNRFNPPLNLVLPEMNDAWGRKPMPGPEGPQPHPNSPPARTSNAATNPPLLENRQQRYKRGSRYVKSFGPLPAEDPNGPDLDQEEMLVLQLIDMRTDKVTGQPRRKPVYYVYEHGTPKDWNNKQTVKLLNDRRGQTIDRVTGDAPWTQLERRFLASLLEEFPDASITELTERFNWRFMGKECAQETMFAWDYISTGRTIESVRYEYLTWKAFYDVGEYPERPREQTDKSEEGIAAEKIRKIRMACFGKKKALGGRQKPDADRDDASGDEEGPKQKAPRKMAVPKSRKPTKKKSDEMVVDSEIDEVLVKPTSLDEELLVLGGFYDHEEVNNSGPSSPPSSYPATPRSSFVEAEVEVQGTASDAVAKDHLSISDMLNPASDKIIEISSAQREYDPASVPFPGPGLTYESSEEDEAQRASVEHCKIRETKTQANTNINVQPEPIAFEDELEEGEIRE
ncbi:hypothetical protein BDV95DRAFT_592437 [Massariosphaeria phaeospora]|uniref:Myb-like domain-containing protein n=1 Tax=Massariosphaeria phaeospora TaxID=100035 RepID=A0A7C8MPY1_9PLEO|nr:hypothetical protein BDV95DRAFT_592437 [Massariosphaeria phaeospora]